MHYNIYIPCIYQRAYPYSPPYKERILYEYKSMTAIKDIDYFC
jgi:hypothetical protein